MSEPRVAGLDCGTVTGWCLPSEGGTYRTGEWNFTPKPAAPTLGRPEEPEGLRFFKFAVNLRGLIQEEGVRGFIIEQPFSRSRRASEVLSGFIAVAEVVCHELGVEYAFVAASTLKAFGRQQGIEVARDEHNREVKGAMKEAMRVHAAAALGVAVTDNEADAWWMVKWFEANRPSRTGEQMALL